jgi:hypothetical protein
MDRRELLGWMGAGIGTIAIGELGETARAQEATPLTYNSQLGAMAKSCLKACTACAASCGEASHHCLEELAKGSEHRDHHAMTHQLTMDCAAICGVSASLVARQSPLMATQCQACAEACRACAEACDRDETHAEIMKECARICRACEKTCRDMAGHGHATR